MGLSFSNTKGPRGTKTTRARPHRTPRPQSTHSTEIVGVDCDTCARRNAATRTPKTRLLPLLPTRREDTIEKRSISESTFPYPSFIRRNVSRVVLVPSPSPLLSLSLFALKSVRRLVFRIRHLESQSLRCTIDETKIYIPLRMKSPTACQTLRFDKVNQATPKLDRHGSRRLCVSSPSPGEPIRDRKIKEARNHGGFTVPRRLLETLASSRAPRAI